MWYCWVPFIVKASSKHPFKNESEAAISLCWIGKFYLSYITYCPFIQISRGLDLVVGLCNLARAASLLTECPTPSQGPFPCAEAEKCHSAFILESSSCRHRLRKFFLFLYWAAEPSEIINLFWKLLKLVCSVGRVFFEGVNSNSIVL